MKVRAIYRNYNTNVDKYVEGMFKEMGAEILDAFSDYEWGNVDYEIEVDLNQAIQYYNKNRKFEQSSQDEMEWQNEKGEGFFDFKEFVQDVRSRQKSAEPKQKQLPQDKPKQTPPEPKPAPAAPKQPVRKNTTKTSAKARGWG